MALLIRAAAAALAAGAAAGCLRDPDPIVYELTSVAVHAMLEAGEPDAGVLLTTFPPGAGQAQPAAGAAGFVGVGADSVPLAPGGPGGRPCRWPFAPGHAESEAGCHHAALGARLAPGADAWLRVRYPSGEVARGSVRVPLRPEIVEPAADGHRVEAPPRWPSAGPGITVPSVDVPFRWVWDDPSAVLFFLVEPGTGFHGGVSLDERCHGYVVYERDPMAPVEAGTPAGGSARLQVHGASCHGPAGEVAWDSVRVPVVLFATDTAAARYNASVSGSGGVRPEAAAAGVRGAYGLFGASARARRVLTVVPAP
jgi:hypothetical protein